MPCVSFFYAWYCCMKELLNISAALQDLDDQPCALATVIEVEGSSYRRPGARMLLSPDGRSWGMISGGCLEHDVMDHARRTLESGHARTVRYDSTSADDIVFGTGLGCNGVINVFIEPVTRLFRRLFIRAVDSCNRTRECGGIATLMNRESGVVRSWEHAFLSRCGNWIGGGPSLRELDSVFTGINGEPDGEAFTAELSGGTVFIQPLLPPIHLVIFGGWLDVVPLIHIAKELGFCVTVVDARQGASSPALFREADSVLRCSPAEAVTRLKFDHRTAVVLMAHHFERDQEALGALARTNPFYIGMLGPKRRQEKILAALDARNVVFADGFAGKLCGPAGLDLGATSPETIALAILAEIQAKHTGRSGGMLNGRTSRIEADTTPHTMNLEEAVPSPVGGPA